MQISHFLCVAIDYVEMLENNHIKQVRNKETIWKQLSSAQLRQMWLLGDQGHSGEPSVVGSCKWSNTFVDQLWEYP